MTKEQIKALCLLEDYQDIKWIQEYYSKNYANEEIIIIVLSFSGRLAANKIDLPCKIYSEISWQINWENLRKCALKKILNWHKIENAYIREKFDQLKSMSEYPFFEISNLGLYSITLLLMYTSEIIETIIDRENPDKFIVGGKISSIPISLSPHVSRMTYSYLEKRIAKSICKQQDIDFYEIPTSTSMYRSFKELKNKLQSFLFQKLPQRFLSKVEKGFNNLYKHFLLALLHRKNINAILKSTDDISPRILFFAWGDYYLNDILPVIESLLEKKIKIYLIFVRGSEYSITPHLLKLLNKKGLYIFAKLNFRVPNENILLNKWSSAAASAEASMIQEDIDFYRYFSHKGKSFFNIIFPILRSSIREIPNTIIEIARTELIMTILKPDLVVSQFSASASPYYGACDVLPARLMKIPTLSLTHGVVGCIPEIGYNRSGQYLASCGEYHKSILVNQLGYPKDNVFPIGLPRLDGHTIEVNISDKKIEFGFNPNTPLCIFCSNSEMPGSVDPCHSTYDVLDSILNLKKNLPNLQIVYRVHHGYDYHDIKMYIESLNIPGLFFQESLKQPHPIFMDLVQAADFVISHSGSQITESLVLGIPVIYLCATSLEVDTSYLNCDVIYVVDRLSKLVSTVKNILESPLTRHEVRKLAQSYLDLSICGADGRCIKNLETLILNLIKNRSNLDLNPLDDWLMKFENHIHF